MKLQAPKGTRDFYPDDMAWRNWITDAWRRVAIRNGFEQVDGPIFESLDLYKVKSGEGIVSELFHFTDRGERDLAIRPEFTPTLARMVAERANGLPKPIKWFCTPNLCRAERPQRGRLREFWQWNVDILGHDPAHTPLADAECIFTAIDFLADVGLTPQLVRVKISHRQTVRHILAKLGVGDDKMLDAFDLLDRRAKISPEQFLADAGQLGLDGDRLTRFDEVCRRKYAVGDLSHLARSIGLEQAIGELEALDDQLRAFGIADWCEYDLGIVRGLAYYTGTVFEVHERSGAERAMAGGGRYDQLIELFGGPPTPAVGFGMGDVVLTNVLIDKKLVPAEFAPRPQVFVIAASDAAALQLPAVVAELRRAGLHARFSYKSTRNVGKLLKDAGAAKAAYALILGDDLQLKNLATGAQAPVTPDGLIAALTA
jgi:histidyl-tRNA synthetase